MRAFLTGSQCYGKPDQYKSDIDLVVLVSPEDLDAIRQCKGVSEDEPDNSKYANAGSASMRFGKLNLIAVTKPEDYEAWFLGTADCLRLARQRDTFDEETGLPLEWGSVTREEAVSLIRQRRIDRGLDFLGPVESDE